MDKNTIIRSIVALIVALADILKMFGIDFGIDSEAVYGVVSLVVGIWIWWKNNSFSVEAKTADKIMKELKANAKKIVETAEEPEDSEAKE